MKFFSDAFGQDILAGSADVLEPWNATMLGFLAHTASTPLHLAEVLKREPDFALAHALKGLFYVLLGRREMVDLAQEALATAQSALGRRSANAREKAFVTALASWMDGSPRGTIAAMESILETHPEDALAAKISHATRFILGDSRGMRVSMERILPAYGADHPARGYILGCYSFSLEETGDFTKAETAGRNGIALAPNDAWGLHSVAHVYDMTANPRGGLAWLSGREAAWEHCNNFRYHVWWHKALMHLELGERDAVLDLYDTRIRKEQTDDYRDIANGTSMLMRLELEGVDVGKRWEELADLAEKRTDDGCLIFADLHYLLALVGGNRDQAITGMMARLRRTAAARKGEMAAVAANPGIAAAAGLEAFGEGDYRSAYLNLASVRRAMQTIGGSHAQRDVFERLTIDAAIRAGCHEEAAAIIADRTEFRGGRPDNYARARLDLIARAAPAALSRRSQAL